MKTTCGGRRSAEKYAMLFALYQQQKQLLQQQLQLQLQLQLQTVQANINNNKQHLKAAGAKVERNFISTSHGTLRALCRCKLNVHYANM